MKSKKFCSRCVLQVEDGLRSHAKQNVKDTEVWLKTIAIGKDLPIVFRQEIVIGQWMFGVDDIAEVGNV